jgi:two-component system sensor histidine kinase PhoQ
VSVDDAFSEARQNLSFLVEDDGPGISAEDRIRIGQRGVRTDETVPGHGIGLAMVQDTVELYGGTMTIRSSSALGGAAFEIRLPGR